MYSLLNGKGIGQPNSAPIGADLFFEVEDALYTLILKPFKQEILETIQAIFLLETIKIVM